MRYVGHSCSFPVLIVAVSCIVEAINDSAASYKPRMVVFSLAVVILKQYVVGS